MPKGRVRILAEQYAQAIRELVASGAPSELIEPLVEQFNELNEKLAYETEGMIQL